MAAEISTFIIVLYIKTDVKEFLEQCDDKWSRQGIHDRKWLLDKDVRL